MNSMLGQPSCPGIGTSVCSRAWSKPNASGPRSTRCVTLSQTERSLIPTVGAVPASNRTEVRIQLAPASRRVRTYAISAACRCLTCRTGFDSRHFERTDERGVGMGNDERSSDVGDGRPPRVDYSRAKTRRTKAGLISPRFNSGQQVRTPAPPVETTSRPASPSLRSRSSWTKARLACCSKPPLQRRSKMPRLM